MVPEQGDARVSEEADGISGLVRDALAGLISDGIVTGVRLVGLAGYDGRLKPIFGIAMTGKQPELHAAAISRLLAQAGLDVDWTIDRSTGSASSGGEGGGVPASDGKTGEG